MHRTHLMAQPPRWLRKLREQGRRRPRSTGRASRHCLKRWEVGSVGRPRRRPWPADIARFGRLAWRRRQRQPGGHLECTAAVLQAMRSQPEHSSHRACRARRDVGTRAARCRWAGAGVMRSWQPGVLACCVAVARPPSPCAAQAPPAVLASRVRLKQQAQEQRHGQRRQR